jgi:hypothetical protein
MRAGGKRETVARSAGPGRRGRQRSGVQHEQPGRALDLQGREHGRRHGAQPPHHLACRQGSGRR